MKERSEFEILCVTMHQTDFSKIKEMNIHSNVVFANQGERTAYEEHLYDGIHTAKMISTETRGVGINRNLSLMYGSGQYCLFADDDVCYKDNVEELVVNEFKSHPDADIFIFHLDTDSVRKQKSYKETRKVRFLERKSWGGFRIAFNLDSIRKKNVFFSTLLGGGCVFPSGEDSMWIVEAKRKKLQMYVSKETIGTVSFEKSSWFTGYNEKYFYGQGALYHAIHKDSYILWFLYFAFRTRKMTSMKFRERLKWMSFGYSGYDSLTSFDEFMKQFKTDS